MRSLGELRLALTSGSYVMRSLGKQRDYVMRTLDKQRDALIKQAK